MFKVPRWKPFSKQILCNNDFIQKLRDQIKERGLQIDALEHVLYGDRVSVNVAHILYPLPDFEKELNESLKCVNEFLNNTISKKAERSSTYIGTEALHNQKEDSHGKKDWSKDINKEQSVKDFATKKSRPRTQESGDWEMENTVKNDVHPIASNINPPSGYRYNCQPLFPFDTNNFHEPIYRKGYYHGSYMIPN